MNIINAFLNAVLLIRTMYETPNLAFFVRECDIRIYFFIDCEFAPYHYRNNMHRVDGSGNRNKEQY
jgi:hypothetical protein